MTMQVSKLARLDYQDGGQSRYQVPRQHFMHRLRLRVQKGSFVGGSSPAFIANAGNKLIRRIELSIGGQVTKENLSFESLRRLNILQYRDNLASEGYAYLDLGRLPTFKATSIELIVTWASLASVTTGTPTSTTGTYVDVVRFEELNVGQSTDGIPLVLRKTQTIGANSTTAPDRKDVRSGNVLQAIVIVPSSTTLITDVSVIQDGVKYLITKESWADLREQNKADFELDGVQTDFAVLNFDAFGDGSQALRTSGMNTLELEFTTASEAGGSIELVLVEVATPQ